MATWKIEPSLEYTASGSGIKIKKKRRELIFLTLFLSKEFCATVDTFEGYWFTI